MFAIAVWVSQILSIICVLLEFVVTASPHIAFRTGFHYHISRRIPIRLEANKLHFYQRDLLPQSVSTRICLTHSRSHLLVSRGVTGYARDLRLTGSSLHTHRRYLLIIYGGITTWLSHNYISDCNRWFRFQVRWTC